MNRRTFQAATLTMVLSAAVLGGCARTSATTVPEPGSASTPRAQEATQAVDLPTLEPSWDRIEREGRIVVGTSADYPPFAYFDEDFRIAGLDPALMAAIGEELGVEVEIDDFAFEGLGDALHVGQIDAAIAALTVTPERAALVDFTRPYYAGTDALLVARDSAITVTRVEDLASLLVGVQKGSVYESGIQQQLVDTGLMAPTQLFSYPKIDQAVDDLVAGRLAAVALDLQPAERFAEDGTVRIGAQGLHDQSFAVAVRQGDAELLDQLNGALDALEADGTLQELVERYVGPGTAAEAVQPAEPVPAVTPEPPPPCVDAMQRVADLTYDDQGMTAPPSIPAGQPFVKTWRVLNSGTCTWNPSYSLLFDRGNVPAASMGGIGIPVPGEAAPGATVDLSVNLVAPPVPGVYQGLWQLQNSVSEGFGETLTVGIVVPIPPTPTPAPTQTPVPGISFTVDRTSITAGQCVQFTWSVQGARMVYLFPAGQSYQGRDVAPEGVRTECPASTTTFVLRAEMTSGAVEEREITVVVDPVAGLPTIAEFRADPPRIAAGGCVDVWWDVVGAVDSVRVSRAGGALWNSAPFRGSMRDCPPGRGDIPYRIEAAGPGGTARAEAWVRVD